MIRNPQPFQGQAPLSGQYHLASYPGTLGTNASLGNGTLRLAPWYLSAPATIDRIGSDISSAGSAGALLRLGIYADNGQGYPGALVLDAGTVDGTSATVSELTVSQVLPLGLYWVGAVVQGAPSTQPTVRVLQSPLAFPLSRVGSSAPTAALAVVGYSQTSVTGALPSTFTTTIAPTTVAPRLFVRFA